MYTLLHHCRLRAYLMICSLCQAVPHSCLILTQFSVRILWLCVIHPDDLLLLLLPSSGPSALVTHVLLLWMVPHEHSNKLHLPRMVYAQDTPFAFVDNHKWILLLPRTSATITKTALCSSQDSYSQYIHSEHPIWLYSSTTVLVLCNSMVWHHHEKDRFPFEYGLSQGFFLTSFQGLFPWRSCLQLAHLYLDFCQVLFVSHVYFYHCKM